MSEPKIFYEAHVTVQNSEGKGLSDSVIARLNHKYFANLCEQRLDGKALLIELVNNNHIVVNCYHLMLSASHQFENDEFAEEWIRGLAETCTHDKWVVNRVKLESQLCPGPGDYYEAHWTIAILGSQLGELGGFLRQYPQFKYSFSMLDRGKHYLTARYYEYDQTSAGKYFAEMGALVGKKFNISKGHAERVVFDSNPSLDLGWAIDRM